MSALEEWKAIAEYHKKQLVIAEQKVQELSPVVEEEPEKLSPSEMRKRVIALAAAKSAAYKRSWKKAVTDGLLENVQGILNEAYPSLKSSDSNDGTPVTKVMEVIGKKDSLKRQEFELRVIERLYKNGSFNEEDGGIDTFEDTAGGCDEITWNVACELVAE